MGRVERDQLKYNKIRTKDKFVDQFNYWNFTLKKYYLMKCDLFICDIVKMWLITFTNKFGSFQIIPLTSPWAPRCPRMPRRMSSASILRKLVGVLTLTLSIYLVPGNASQDSETNIFSGVLELLTKSLVQLYEVGWAPLPSELWFNFLITFNIDIIGAWEA